MLNLLRKLFYAALLLAVLTVPASAQTTPGEASKQLPESFGEFRAQGLARQPSAGIFESVRREDFKVLSEAQRTYISPDGHNLEVYLVKTNSDSAAYALLTYVASSQYAPPYSAIKTGGVGTASVGGGEQISFFKGKTFVTVKTSDKQPSGAADLTNLARLLAEPLEAGENTIPVLVQHLPDPDKVQEGADYALSLSTLQTAAGRRPILDAVSFEGGAESVTAKYGDARVVIVEFTTPQYAEDNDARINERIKQLRESGQSLPSSYQRVGNYAVFVFDAPDETTTAQLASAVKYEKEVRWLGDNPHAQARAEQRYTNTMGNVILTTLKTTGVAILLCLGVGGLFGGAVFLYRRARTTANATYSDAGGMMRLNLEDANGAGSASRLIGKSQS